MKIDVSIVFPTFNRKDLAVKALRSIIKYTKGINYEIIVVDDGSSDGTPEEIKKQFPKDVKLLVNKKNMGPLFADNRGFKQSKGKYLIIYDNDVFLESNVLKKMMDYMEENKDVGVCGCKVVGKDRDFQRSMGNVILPNYKTILYSIIDRLVPNNKITETWKESEEAHENITETACIKCTCGMMRREAVREVGLFDEQYFMYVDEIDWMYRFTKKGWKIMHLPYGPVMHYGGTSGIHNNNQRRAEKFELLAFKNIILFYKKHYGFLSSIGYRIWMFPLKLKDLVKDIIKKDKEEFKIDFKKLGTLFSQVENNPEEGQLKD
jgi:GT2 family glycosyltransferase